MMSVAPAFSAKATSSYPPTSSRQLQWEPAFKERIVIAQQLCKDSLLCWTVGMTAW